MMPERSAPQSSDPHRRLHFEELISEISARMIDVPFDQVDQEIERSLGQIRVFFQVDRCGLVRTSKDRKTFQITHASIADGSPPIPIGTELPTSLFPWAADRLLNQHEVNRVNTMESLPEGASADRRTWEEWGIKSVLDVPIVIRGYLDYIISANAVNTECDWPVEFIPRLRLLGEIFVSALERKRKELEIRLKLREIEDLKQRLEKENIILRSERLFAEHTEIIGQGELFKKLMTQARQVAQTESTVLLLGETGTGKELVAQAIHALSRRKDRLMVKVNCASLPAALIENELFGREKGAYTGALTRQMGRFELANGSSLFLDEVAELPLELQSKLLRVLEQGEFERLGSPQTIRVNVRLIAATNRNLIEAVRSGKFREDLYYRLNVFPIHVPPLRERTADIPIMVRTFINEFSSRMGKQISEIPQTTMEALTRYSWPGNVRELRNVIEQAMILSDGRTLEVRIPDERNRPANSAITLQEAESQHIREALEKSGGRIKGAGGAARMLGLKPSTLYAKMQKLGIPSGRERADSAD